MWPIQNKWYTGIKVVVTDHNKELSSLTPQPKKIDSESDREKYLYSFAQNLNPHAKIDYFGDEWYPYCTLIVASCMKYHMSGFPHLGLQ